MSYLTGTSGLLLISGIFAFSAVMYLKDRQYWDAVYAGSACLINLAVVMKG